MGLISAATILFGVCLAGELITRLFNLPVPGSIVGMLLLLLLFCLKIVKPKQVEPVTKPLLQHMTLLFIPAGAGIMVSFGLLKDSIAAFVVVSAAGTLAVLLLTGFVTQLVQRRISRRERKGDTHE